MAIPVGVALLAAGAMLMMASLILTLRANPGVRVPLWRNAPVVPPHAVRIRVAAVPLFVGGAIVLAMGAGAGGAMWGVLGAAVLLVGAMVLTILRHNSRVGAAT